MDGCARISRVLEGISACQLYVHRCRMNLEQSEKQSPVPGDVHVLPCCIPEGQWDWRQNYRVWEAFLKVFCYPENWLEPDLRDNKTTIFKQLESELLQREINSESIEGIYKNYLRDLAKLAKLIIVSALYDDRVEDEETYWFFARTPHDPYEYYLRRFINKSTWTPWEKIDLTIGASSVSPVLHQGRLYLFWVSFIPTDDAMGIDASEVASETSRYVDPPQSAKSQRQPVLLEYAFRTASGQWNEPQSLQFYRIETSMRPLPPFFSRVYPESKSLISVIHPKVLDNISTLYQIVGYVDEFHNEIRDKEGDPVNVGGELEELLANVQYRSSGLRVPSRSVLLTQADTESYLELAIQVGTISYFTSEASADYPIMRPADESIVTVMQFPRFRNSTYLRAPDFFHDILRIVHNRLLDNLFYYKDQQFLIYRTDRPGYDDKTPEGLLENIAAVGNSKRRMVRLTTTVADRLGAVLFNYGLEAFLHLTTQQMTEVPLEGPKVRFKWLGELGPPVDAVGPVERLSFKGAYGTYFGELFFDIPLLVAHYLNASQKFALADLWYRKVFDPTASENTPKPTDRNWRYIEFRSQKEPKLRDILTDAAAIQQYRQDPFNPWAIGRLRISAFQKTVVMKYIDNLLDWGDHLFAQDTFESINEATMLYVMAADILGDRPAEVGDCKTTTEFQLTYQNILSHKLRGSEFLIELENLVAYWNLSVLGSSGDDKEDDNGHGSGDGFLALRKTGKRVTPFNQFKSATREPISVSPAHLLPQLKVAAKVSADTAAHRSLAFCVPPNDKLLSYWDRVGDRLFKIRNCMNLQGVRRRLGVFQPPIDPARLVKAKALGLSLEDVLKLLSAEVPSYRFTFLIEKARQFVGTIQGFGSALLNALEKKDTEVLTLLRSVHEQELLKALREVKVENTKEAEASKKSLEEAQEAARIRKVYHQELLDNAKDKEYAMNEYEVTHLKKLEEGRSKQESAAQAELDASAYYKLPSWEFGGQAGGGWNWSVGGGFGYGTSSLGYGSSNLAAQKTSDAQKRRKEALGLEFEGNQAYIKGGYIRRKAEWGHQKSGR
jgi:hypothetical protein